MKVSVLLITYNHEKYIAQAIESILSQETTFDYELVIIEDYSTDRTREMVIDYGLRYPDKIRLLLAEKNECSNRDFARAYESAPGQYIAVLDGDDYWTSPYKLQKQADYLDSHPECAICFHNVKLLYEDGSESFSFPPGQQKEFSTLEDLWAGCFIDTCSVMLRQGLFARFPDWFNTCPAADWPLHILAAQYGKIGCIDEVMAVYRKHSGGIWSAMNKAQKLEQVIGLYEQINAGFDYRYDKAIKEFSLQRCYELATEYEKIGHLKQASKYLGRCLAERPAWLEDYWAARAVKRDEVWRYLQRQVWLYQHPILYRSLKGLRPFAALMRRVGERAVNFQRALAGCATGSITATPNPIPGSEYVRVGATTLSWVAQRTDLVEVHVGAPDGPLFHRSGPLGSGITGAWVSDGMVFYLQDVSDGRPLIPKHTLAIITVNLAPPPDY